VIRQIGLPESNLSHVNRAIGWIRDNYAERMRISDLARLSRMSPSAFHRSFRAITAMSPRQFQKRIRLQEARSLLAEHPGVVAGPGRRPPAGRQLAEVPLEEPRDLVDGLVGLVQCSELKLEDVRAFAGHL
jgi:hypothetical protein